MPSSVLEELTISVKWELIPGHRTGYDRVT